MRSYLHSYQSVLNQNLKPKSPLEDLHQRESDSIEPSDEMCNTLLIGTRILFTGFNNGGDRN